MPNNFQLNAGLILKDIYRLVLLVTSDADFLKIVDDKADPLWHLRDLFLEDELVHTLVSTAVSNRIQLDHMSDISGDGGPRDDTTPNLNCGELQKSFPENEVTEDLTFREACNKIIHAVHIVVETGGDPAYYPIHPEITLRGTHGVSWQARLNLIEYARASVLNFRRLA